MWNFRLALFRAAPQHQLGQLSRIRIFLPIHFQTSIGKGLLSLKRNKSWRVLNREMRIERHGIERARRRELDHPKHHVMGHTGEKPG